MSEHRFGIGDRVIPRRLWAGRANCSGTVLDSRWLEAHDRQPPELYQNLLVLWDDGFSGEWSASRLMHERPTCSVCGTKGTTVGGVGKCHIANLGDVVAYLERRQS